MPLGRTATKHWLLLFDPNNAIATHLKMLASGSAILLLIQTGITVLHLRHEASDGIELRTPGMALIFAAFCVLGWGIPLVMCSFWKQEAQWWTTLYTLLMACLSLVVVIPCAFVLMFFMWFIGLLCWVVATGYLTWRIVHSSYDAELLSSDEYLTSVIATPIV